MVKSEFDHDEMNETKFEVSKDVFGNVELKLDTTMTTTEIEVVEMPNGKEIKFRRLRDPTSPPSKFAEFVMKMRAYIYGICFALSVCMANILIKMAPSLDGSNHSAIRYLRLILDLKCR